MDTQLPSTIHGSYLLLWTPLFRRFFLFLPCPLFEASLEASQIDQERNILSRCRANPPLKPPAPAPALVRALAPALIRALAPAMSQAPALAVAPKATS